MGSPKQEIQPSRICAEKNCIVEYFQQFNSLLSNTIVEYCDSLFLSFEDFCNNVMRWGTSRAATRTDFLGQSLRTKWAWEFKHLTNDTRKDLRENPDL